MEIKLANGEKIIKEWNYAEAGHRLDKGGKVKRHLTVTNKRVISWGDGKHHVDYKELPIGDIKSVDGSVDANGSFWAKLQFIISIPLCLVIIGIPMLISARRKLRACSFKITFTTNLRYGQTASAGFAMEGGDVRRGHLFGKSLINRFKVYANKQDALEIISEIGALILDKGQVAEEV